MKQQVGDGRARERGPEPRRGARTKRQPSREVAATSEAPRATGARRAQSSSVIAETMKERRRGRTRRRPRRRHQHAADRRACHPEDDRAHELVERVRLRRAARGHDSGTSASNAGAKNAAPVPYTAAMTAICHTSMEWVSASTASAAPATARADPPPPSPCGGRSGRSPLRRQEEDDRRNRHRDARRPTTPSAYSTTRRPATRPLRGRRRRRAARRTSPPTAS